MSAGNFSCESSYIVSMEILLLLCLYFLTQKPDFNVTIQPLLSELKNSEELLRFLKDLSSFADLLGKKPKEKEKAPPCKEAEKGEHKEKPQSQASGIADGFIEKFLSDYLNRSKS